MNNPPSQPPRPADYTQVKFMASLRCNILLGEPGLWPSFVRDPSAKTALWMKCSAPGDIRPPYELSHHTKKRADREAA